MTRVALRLLGPLATIALTGSICFALNPARWRLPCAVAMSTALLMLLHGNRRHLDPVTLRAAADFCLLTPLLFVGPLLS